MFDLKYAKSVARDLNRIDQKQIGKVRKATETLTNFPDLPNLKKLSAHPLADYRLRVGDYRILFDVNWEDKTIFILKIGHRKEVY